MFQNHTHIITLTTHTQTQIKQKKNIPAYIVVLPCRYEIEYDENRLEIGRDIGKRFLGIPYADDMAAIAAAAALATGEQNNITSTGTTNNSLTGGDDEPLAATPQQPPATAPVVVDKEKYHHHHHLHHNPHPHHLNKEQINGIVGSGGGGGGDVTIPGETDELVLDVLNDDLISKVQEKITRKKFFPFFI